MHAGFEREPVKLEFHHSLLSATLSIGSELQIYSAPAPLTQGFKKNGALLFKVKAFSPFLVIMYSVLPNINFHFSVTLALSYASAFNLDQSKNLLFGNEFILGLQRTPSAFCNQGLNSTILHSTIVITSQKFYHK